MPGLMIETERGTIDVPREIEAEGGAAIEAHVSEQIALLPAPVAPSAPPSDPEE